MRKLIFIGFALLGACTYPSSDTQQGSKPGQLYFPNAPADARVMIDGTEQGLASAFDGKTVLEVSPGTHRIVLLAGNTPFLDKRYYVEAGAKVAVRND